MLSYSDVHTQKTAFGIRLFDRVFHRVCPKRLQKMTSLFSSMPAFIGRHWLRIIIVGVAIFIFSRKQVNFNIRLGAPGITPVEAPAGQPPTAIAPASVLSAADEGGGFFSQFNIFGGSEGISLYDALGRQDEATIEAFIRRFSNVAQAEQEKFGVPASITLASAMLHTAAGSGESAANHNNYFSLGCTDDWAGPTGRTGAGCIRRYESAWTSFRDHSLYLTSGKFSPLTQFTETDYRRWAAGLEELGFSDTDDLAKQLLRTVDKYQIGRAHV